MARKRRGFEWVREDVDGEAIQQVERRNRGEEKRRARASESLALAIIAAPKGIRAKLPLDEVTLEAVEELARLPPAPARRRQLLVVKGLLNDADHEAVQEVLEGRGEHAERSRVLERWRTRILEEGDTALAEFIDAHPDADRQRIRALAREARKEGPAGARASKNLFAALKGA